MASRELRKTIPLVLKKGKNEVEVTAYNSRNVASETQVLHLNSLGIKNPPSMYVLSVGLAAMPGRIKICNTPEAMPRRSPLSSESRAGPTSIKM